MKNILITFIVTSVIFTFWATFRYPQAFIYIDTAYSYVGGVLATIGDGFMHIKDNMAAVLLHDPVTVPELHQKYAASMKDTKKKKVRVLVVAGHEPNYGGAEYSNLKERDMNVELAKNLVQFLKNNGNYDVLLSRDEKEWNPQLLEYFKTEWDEIIAFYKDNKQDVLHSIATGKVTQTVANVAHNKAPVDVALRLYGINKWENENSIDIAIHVHFNDNPRSNPSGPGKYSGFAVYVPERQYSNSTTTIAVAESIFKRLAKYNAVSNLPMEDEGIIEEPDLIAIGAYNTTNAASMLIEYGYIYEPQFADPAVRSTTIKDLAFQTYLGLQDFFGSGNDVSLAYDTLMLPHSWTDDLAPGKGESKDVLALQTALLLDGVYPGTGKTKNDCPRTGKIGPCTVGAINAFQKKYGIKGEEDVVGDKTREKLNSKYSVRVF